MIISGCDKGFFYGSMGAVVFYFCRDAVSAWQTTICSDGEGTEIELN